jgi:alpha-glucosidase
MGLHHCLQYGIFLDSTYKSFVNFGASNNRFSSFSADAGDMNYYFFGGSSIAEILNQYARLTGFMPLPPRWSIGYQQCRYSYYPDHEVMNIATTFRDKKIPADVIVFDIHYMDKYKIFTWHKDHFPDPKQLIENLKKLGFEVVVMCDPGIKIEEDYPTYQSGLQHNVFLKYPDGTPYAGQVWPGWCYFPDFTNPTTRAWWKEQFRDYVQLGIEGFWNDMNELATWGHMLPEHIEFDFDGHRASMRRGRNIYGFQMARATYEGTRELMNGKRPFNLTRSAFSGIQRYAAVWTGDNVAYDEHMMLGVRLVNSMGLTGMPFVGYDVGGFVGDATTKLFTRWVSIGSLSPFFRGHSMINSRDSEPWSYGEEAEQICRNYIRFRYRLMPYLYSLFREASRTGMPVQRSLSIPYAHHAKVYDHQYHHQYLLGPFILVAPVESTKEITKVFLPPGEWYYVYTGQRYAGDQEILLECPLHRLPVFVKDGALLPMQKPGNTTRDAADELEIHVYNGKSPSEFTLYTDDGSTYEYEHGSFAERLVSLVPAENRLIIYQQTGSYPVPVQTIKVVWHGFPNLSSARIANQNVWIQQEINRFFDPLEKYDPINDPEPAPEEAVQVTRIPYTSEEINITWL